MTQQELEEAEKKVLPTQKDVQAEFDIASAEGVSPCMWIPPTWELLEANKFSFRNTTSEDTLFSSDKVKKDWLDHVNACDKEEPRGPEYPPHEKYWPNPFSDFSHEHPDDEHESSAGDLGPNAVRVIESLQDSAVQDAIPTGLKLTPEAYGEALQAARGNHGTQGAGAAAVADILEVDNVKEAIMRAQRLSKATFDRTITLLRNPKEVPAQLNALDKLRALFATDSSGMQRLGQVFDFVLCRITRLLNDLNTARDAKAMDAYNTARTNYLNFLRDLDDRHPEEKETPPHRPIKLKDKTARSGYGRALKWACIDPVIFGNRIVGTRVVIEWNPHSSSSGIPIPHAPY